jgi:hypothetical protein
MLDTASGDVAPRGTSARMSAASNAHSVRCGGWPPPAPTPSSPATPPSSHECHWCSALQ